MREWCGCGAAIRARRRDVIAWRTAHRCVTQPAEEPSQQIVGGAYVERAWDQDTSPRIGFHS